MLLLQGRRGGIPDRPTTEFVDWAILSNPVLEEPDRLLKNQAIVYDDGWFWVVAPDTLRRTRDFVTYEAIDVPGGRWFGDVSRLGGVWYQTTNGNVGGDQFEIFARTSLDLLTWTPLASITPGLSVNPIIDGALVEHGGFAFLVFKDRVQQVPYVTRSITGTVDGTWLPPQRAVAGSLGVLDGFAEAFHFLTVDGQLRVVGTGRDPEPFRCTDNPVYFIYTCSHEPFIYTLPGVTTDLSTWTTWRHKTHLRVPYETWNPIMHANGADSSQTGATTTASSISRTPARSTATASTSAVTARSVSPARGTSCTGGSPAICETDSIRPAFGATSTGDVRPAPHERVLAVG